MIRNQDVYEATMLAWQKTEDELRFTAKLAKELELKDEEGKLNRMYEEAQRLVNALKARYNELKVYTDSLSATYTVLPLIKLVITKLRFNYDGNVFSFTNRVTKRSLDNSNTSLFGVWTEMLEKGLKAIKELDNGE